MKKYILSSALWGILIVLAQILIFVVEKTVIDWKSAITGGIVFFILHLFVCCGREYINKK